MPVLQPPSDARSTVTRQSAAARLSGQPAARMLQIADLQQLVAGSAGYACKPVQGSFPHPFWLLPCATSLQSPGMASQQPECCKLQICNSKMLPNLQICSHMKPHCRALEWPASSQNDPNAYLHQLVAGCAGYACKGLLPSILASAM